MKNKKKKKTKFHVFIRSEGTGGKWERETEKPISSEKKARAHIDSISRWCLPGMLTKKMPEFKIIEVIDKG